ncbi:replication protein [Acetobacter sp. AN02]|uniref:replication protein n=1 Tax=Acetobacter sp. AN02 TaxID=2894186 RepID=UPI0024344B88|nr:replication protein [Acetobacter sp. AN02]MDG6095813.1 replication protein [Acetobacter sp. AN02]
MSADSELAAFDQLGREMAETNRLLRTVRSDQATRNQQEQALSAEMNTALKQATGASQEALQASQTEIRSSPALDGTDGLPDRSGGVWRGNLDLLTMCRGNEWTTERQKGGIVCFPYADPKGNVTGWYLP